MKTEPVRTEDGHIESFLIALAGNAFSCQCGCDCFHKPDKTKLGLYECNSCGARFLDKSKDM